MQFSIVSQLFFSIVFLFYSCDKKTGSQNPSPGFQFSPVSSPSSQSMNEVKFTGSNTGYIAGDGGIFKTTNGGNTWSHSGSTGASTIYVVNENVVYAGGYNGVLF